MELFIIIELPFDN